MAIDGDNGRTSTVGGGNTGYNWSGYAEWLAKTKNSTKTCNLIVNYYANGYNGSAAENPPPSSVRSYTGQSVDVRLVVEVASGDTMSNPGYVFVGWATSNNTATITYNPGDTISNSWAADYRGNSVTNLYAVWTNQNVITYNPDDNSIEKSAIYQVKQSGQSATLKGATFTRTGYTQTGWATTAGGPKVYNLGGTYSSNNPLSLYPVWQANTYTITYVANEGTGTMADQTVTYDSTFTPRACSFTREGYSFSSWNESQDGKGIRWKVQEYTVDRAENITLYAIWKGNEYTVYYDDNYSRYSDEITGDIVTFESEYAQPLKKAEVSLSPIQDLHGYANPWPAGGGANQWDEEWERGTIGMTTGAKVDDNTKIRSKNYVPISPNTAYYYKFPGNWRMVYFDSDKNVVEQGNTYSPNIILTSPATAHYLLFALDATTEYDNNIAINYPSTVTTYSPYSNICPISGRTGLSVYDDPKYGGTIEWNQQLYFDSDNWMVNGMQCSVNNGRFTLAGTATTTGTSALVPPRIYNKTKLIQGHVYALILSGDTNLNSFGFTVYGTPNQTINLNTIQSVIFTCNSANSTDAEFVAQYNVGEEYSADITSYLCDLTLAFGAGNEPTTVDAFKALFYKDYYPYNAGTTTCVSAVNGDPYWKKDIDWTSQAGTVYGGTLDVVTGVLTVTHKILDLGTMQWNKTGLVFYTEYSAFDGANDPKGEYLLCSQYKGGDAYGENTDNTIDIRVGTYKRIWIRDTSKSGYTSAQFEAAMDGVQLVYLLATPLTYQLTPTQVEALVGTNNVWSDCGLITIVYALDEVPQNMPPSTAIFGDIFYTRRNQLSRFGLTFKGWNTVPDGSGEAWLPSGVSMGTYKRTEDAVWNVSHNVTLYAQWDPNVYPFGTVFFNGRNAQDLGIIVEELPSYYYAERAFNHKQVNGKNGDVILDTGRYENVKKVYKVACYDPSRNFYESAVALSTFLHSAGSDYIRLEDSYEPSSYRMAIYEETNEIENLLGKAGRCEITFNCMPQRFLLSGDEEITIPSSGYSIYNPTAFDAKPMIRIQGTGTVTINGRSVQVTENDNDMLVDCENQNAKDLSGADMNYFIYCDEFPILKPGFNTISYTETIDAVKITPRWWIL